MEFLAVSIFPNGNHSVKVLEDTISCCILHRISLYSHRVLLLSKPRWNHTSVIQHEEAGRAPRAGGELSLCANRETSNFFCWISSVSSGSVKETHLQFESPHPFPPLIEPRRSASCVAKPVKYCRAMAFHISLIQNKEYYSFAFPLSIRIAQKLRRFLKKLFR